MGLFNKNQSTATPPNQRQVLENAVKSSRNNLLVILGFTLINIILLVSNGNTYFLFSAYVPYLLMDLGMLFGGMYPADVYSQIQIEIFGKGFFGVMAALAAIALLLYLLCWIFSKKNPKTWLVVSLVLFALDTVLLVLIAGISASLIMDYLFHGWVLISLVSGLSAVKKLKALEEESMYLDDMPETDPMEE